jgi:hypothetical protein
VEKACLEATEFAVVWHKSRASLESSRERVTCKKLVKDVDIFKISY